MAPLYASLSLLFDLGIPMPLPILKHIKAKTIEKPVIDPHYFRTEFGKVTCGLDTNNLFNFD